MEMIFGSSIITAFVITCLTAFNQILFTNTVDSGILFFTFFSSFLFYQSRSVIFKKLEFKYYILFFLLIFYLILLSFLNFNKRLILFYFFLFVITFAYRFKINKVSLRTIPFLKPFVIAFVISGFTVLSTYFKNYKLLQLGFVSSIYFSIFFYLVGIAIVSDLKDFNADNQLNLKTFANQLSLNNLKVVVLINFMISFIFFYSSNFNNSTFKVSFYSTLFVSLIAVFFLKKENKNFYYTFLIDGCLTLPLFMYLIILSV